MQTRRAVRPAMLVLLTAALALTVGGRVSVASGGRTSAGETGVAASPSRALDVVLRAEDDSNGGVFARTADQARALPFVAFLVPSLMLAGVRPRRTLSLAGALVRSRSPRRHAVALRAPPTFRLV